MVTQSPSGLRVPLTLSIVSEFPAAKIGVDVGDHASPVCGPHAMPQELKSSSLPLPTSIPCPWLSVSLRLCPRPLHFSGSSGALSGHALDLHLREVLLFCQQRLLVLRHEGIVASLLGEGNERLPAGIIGQIGNQDGRALNL